MGRGQHPSLNPPAIAARIAAPQGEDSSAALKRLGGSRTAFWLTAFLGVAVIINLEACLLVLVAEFNGPENRHVLVHLRCARAPHAHPGEISRCAACAAVLCRRPCPAAG